jgi:hypothetical protein
MRVPQRGALEDEATFQARIDREIDEQLTSRWEALFAYFGESPGDWPALALALARRYVPGFSIGRARARHRPSIWQGSKSLEIIADVLAKRRLGYAEKDIFPALLKMPRYRTLTGRGKEPIRAASLRRRFEEADSRLELPHLWSKLRKKYGVVADDWIIEAAADPDLRRRLNLKS